MKQLEPAVPWLPEKAQDYVFQPEGHAHAGEFRTTDFAVLAITILVVQTLVLLYTRKRAK